ncbi:Uncharacterised protein [Mycoplasmopsis citelli]|uniref:Uncharacterized protein n=1 Tax=Mycoplasmopsis citelli TaxID=171281 RepID=A0A449B2K9_9BACT|nr:hypothetical protein [Mycoplasmopsis citelli]VEU74816.1 Uncharacterised protein [Mycoplasmopsis citelli]
MLTKNKWNKATFELLEDYYDFNTNEFLNVINKNLKTLPTDKQTKYLNELEEIFKENNSTNSNYSEEKRVKILYLATDILKLNPPYEFVRGVNLVLQEQFGYDEDAYFICEYLEQLNINDGRRWWEYLNEELKQDGIKSSLVKFNFEIGEFSQDDYYMFTGKRFEWISLEKLALKVLKSLKKVLLFLNKQIWWKQSDQFAQNLDFLKQKYDFDIHKNINEKFLKQVAKFYTTTQMTWIKYLEDIINSKIIKDENLGKYITDILNTTKNSEIIFELNGAFKDENYFEQCLKKASKESDEFANGTTILNFLDKNLKAQGTHYLKDNDIFIYSVIDKKTWYWIDENSYPIADMTQDEKNEQVLIYFLKKYSK